MLSALRSGQNNADKQLANCRTISDFSFYFEVSLG
jgi:hypothetical protein